MKLEEALPYFRKGKKIYRKEYIEFPIFHHQIVMLHGLPCYKGDGIHNGYDLLADDWEVEE